MVEVGSTSAFGATDEGAASLHDVIWVRYQEQRLQLPLRLYLPIMFANKPDLVKSYLKKKLPWQSCLFQTTMPAIWTHVALTQSLDVYLKCLKKATFSMKIVEVINLNITTSVNKW